jgi:FkbM family methyltransferase
VIERQPEGAMPMQFWCDAMMRGAQSGKQLVVRLEDDIVVAKRLRAAVARWSVTSAPRFGFGSLAAGLGSGIIEQGYAELVGGDALRVASLAVVTGWGQVFRAEDIPVLLGKVNEMRNAERPAIDFDRSLLDAGHALGREHFVHRPYLVWADDVYDRSTHYDRGPGPVYAFCDYVDFGYDPERPAYTLPMKHNWLDRKTLETTSQQALRAHDDGSITVLGGIRMFLDPAEINVCPWLAKVGFWEAWQTVFFAHRIKPGMCVWDLGAHVGYYALLAAALVGPGGYVLAVEPHKRLADVLRRSAEANGFHWLHVVESAVIGDDAAATVTLHTSDGTPDVATVRPASVSGRSLPHDIEVSATTVRKLAAEHRSPDLIIADIEGAEQEAFEAAEDWLRATRPELFIEWSWMFSRPARFAGFWTDLGYRAEELEFDGLGHPVDLAGIAARCVACRATNRNELRESWTNVLLVPT